MIGLTQSIEGESKAKRLVKHQSFVAEAIDGLELVLSLCEIRISSRDEISARRRDCRIGRNRVAGRNPLKFQLIDARGGQFAFPRLDDTAFQIIASNFEGWGNRVDRLAKYQMDLGKE